MFGAKRTRRLIILLAIIGALVSAAGFCQNEMPATHNPASGDVLALITGSVLNPWVTTLLILVGMALVIAEILSIGKWGVTGLAGIASVGCVVGSAVLAGVTGWVGLTVLLAGVGLLLVESRALPGHGISGIAGLIALFLGMYWVLGGASAGILYAASVSAVFALMAAIAFLVHLPHNAAWRGVGRRLEISVGHPYGTMTEPRRSSREEAPGRRTTRTDSDDDQQTLRRS